MGQATSEIWSNQRLDIDGMSGAAKNAARAIESERFPEFNQRLDIIELKGRFKDETLGFDSANTGGLTRQLSLRRFSEMQNQIYAIENLSGQAMRKSHDKNLVWRLIFVLVITNSVYPIASADESWYGPSGNFSTPEFRGGTDRVKLNPYGPMGSIYDSGWGLQQSHTFGSYSSYYDVGVTNPAIFSNTIPSFVAANSRTFLAGVKITTTVDATINFTSYCNLNGSCDQYAPTNTALAWANASTYVGFAPTLPINNGTTPTYYSLNTSYRGTLEPVARPNINSIVGEHVVFGTGYTSPGNRITYTVGVHGSSTQSDSNTYSYTRQSAGAGVKLVTSVDVALAASTGATSFSWDGGPQINSGATTGSLRTSVEYLTGKLKLEWTSAPGDPLANGKQGPQYMRGLLTAVDNNGKNIPINVAAQSMGFDHFNWIQTIVSDPNLAYCHGNASDTKCAGLRTSNGAVPNEGTFDAPAGGWAYQTEIRDSNGSVTGYKTFPVRDNLPFYNDEGYDQSGNFVNSYGNTVANTRYTDLTSLSGVANNDLRSSLNNHKYGSSGAKGLVFYDAPNNSGGTIGFDTILVGVKSAGCVALSSPNDCQFAILSDFNEQWYSHGGIVGFNAEAISLSGSDPGSDPLTGGFITTDQFLQDSHLTTDSLAAMGGSILPAATVPEPTSVAMLLAGLVLLLGIRESKRSQSLSLGS